MDGYILKYLCVAMPANTCIQYLTIKLSVKDDKQFRYTAKLTFSLPR